ncbi:MAG: tetratricopeptide repeat protein [Pseudomonadota bacterium]
MRWLERAAALPAVAWFALITAIAAALLAWLSVGTASVADLFLTRDQQGMRYLAARDFNAAADTFENPEWQGQALYRAGRYAEAAAAWGRVDTAEGFFNRGNAFMKGREYAKAITAYEEAVADAPDWTQARDNLELARHTLDYIERAREQSDTGDETELSADDFVYDNTRSLGRDMVITQESTIEAESAEKWMRSVDTETREFLRTRFLLEATQAGDR